MSFRLISRRDEQGSMVITSNKSFNDWGADLGDDILSTAVLNRLMRHSEVPSMSEPSYRPRAQTDLIPGADMSS